MLIDNISVIIATYKDTEALGLILNSLANQTYKNPFEIIIAEDGKCDEMHKYIQNLTYQNIIHTTQEDLGWQKNKSLNNAINSSSGDLLIFLDADCIPYSNLVENYANNAKPKTVLCGRRVDLGKKYSKKLRDGKLTIQRLENSYLKHYFKIIKDRARHYEEGIKLNNFLHKLKYKNRSSSILGCNFAVNKKDLIEINGFDENYVNPSVGEDTDIEFRLKGIGCIMKPTRNLTNVIHLYHESKYSNDDYNQSVQIFNKTKKNSQFFCNNGLIKS